MELWIEIEKCHYSVKQQTIVAWLSWGQNRNRCEKDITQHEQTLVTTTASSTWIHFHQNGDNGRINMKGNMKCDMDKEADIIEMYRELDRPYEPNYEVGVLQLLDDMDFAR